MQERTYHVIETEGLVPPTQYCYPIKCRYCGCRLNRYNPLDACYPCQGDWKKPGSPRFTAAEMAEIKLRNKNPESPKALGFFIT